MFASELTPVNLSYSVSDSNAVNRYKSLLTGIQKVINCIDSNSDQLAFARNQLSSMVDQLSTITTDHCKTQTVFTSSFIST